MDASVARDDIRLGRNDSLEGNLVYEGGLRVQGTLKGDARVTSDISIERGAVAEARLEGENVTVRGRVQGDVVARGHFLLAGGGVLNGDIVVTRLAIEDGATFNGRVTMAALEGAETESVQAEAAEAEAESQTGGGESQPG
jgi:cytoskeletal protein CcmA (bactofilin family)